MFQGFLYNRDWLDIFRSCMGDWVYHLSS